MERSTVTIPYRFCKACGGLHCPDSELSSHKTYIEKVVLLIPLHYCWAWVALSGGFLAVSLILLLIFERSLANVPVFLIVSALIAQEGIIITWSHKKIIRFGDILKGFLDLKESEIKNLSKSEEKIIFNERLMAVSSIALIVLVHILGIDYHDLHFSSHTAELWLSIGYYFAVYLAGIGLYALIMTAWLVHKIGKLPLDINVFLTSAHPLGVMYSKFTICAASVYSMWGIFHMIVPPRFTHNEVVIWFAFFGILLGAYFMLPQYSIHCMMVKTKDTNLNVFLSQLKSNMADTLNNPSVENITMLKDMVIIHQHLDRMCEWPFGTQETMHVALTIILPLIVLSLEVIFRFKE